MSTERAICLLLLCVGCGTDLQTAAGTTPEATALGGKADESRACGDRCGTLPSAPEVDDERFVIGELDPWLLIGDGLTDDQGRIEVDVLPPPDVEEVVAWIDGESYRLRVDAELRRLEVDLTALGPGRYELLFAEPGAETAFARREIVRSYPLYVFVSIDWDGPDPPDANLERQERLHERHPDLLLTHLVGPYTFTAGLPAERVTAVTHWLERMREQHRDEIGLHIHPYCHFVRETAVDCRLEPVFYDVEAARAGYTVFLFSYTEDEMRQLLRRSKELFVEHGLGTPTSFRAGAWAAQAHTLRALDAEGFVADGSAVNWPLLEEWEGDGPLFGWLRDNWGSIDELSQPYHPTSDDALGAGEEPLNLLEIPDNGALVDYVRTDEMNAVLEANLGDGILDRPRVVSIGYHVDNFSETFFQRMDGTLRFVDERLDVTNTGPVVYARMSELTAVSWVEDP